MSKKTLRSEVLNIISHLPEGQSHRFSGNKSTIASVRSAISYFHKEGYIGKCENRSDKKTGDLVVWKIEG